MFQDNPERAILNRYLLSIGAIDSIPVKPISQLRPILPTTPHPSPRQPRPRNAYALVASAGAHGLVLTKGTKVSRCFAYDGVRAIIENGVARDILKARVASLMPAADPRDEAFCLDGNQVGAIIGLVGSGFLEARGLI